MNPYSENDIDAMVKLYWRLILGLKSVAEAPLDAVPSAFEYLQDAIKDAREFLFWYPENDDANELLQRLEYLIPPERLKTDDPELDKTLGH